MNYRTRWVYRVLACLLFLVALYIFVQIVLGNSVLGIPTSKAFILVLVLIFLSVAPYLVFTIFEFRIGKSAWRQVAKRTGLTFHPKGGPGIPDIGHVIGIFRGRQLTLFACTSYPEMGYEPNYRTVVMVQMNKPVDGDIHLLLTDTIGPDEDKEYRYRSFEKAVEIHSQPKSLALALTFNPAIRQDMLRVRRNSEIRIRGTAITLFQTPHDGMESDISYLWFLFNFVSDLADIIEQAIWNENLVNSTDGGE